MEATLTLFSWCFLTMKLSLGSVFGCQLPSIDITPYFIKLADYTMEFQIVSGDSGFNSMFKLCKLSGGKSIKWSSHYLRVCPIDIKPSPPAVKQTAGLFSVFVFL